MEREGLDQQYPTNRNIVSCLVGNKFMRNTMFPHTQSQKNLDTLALKNKERYQTA